MDTYETTIKKKTVEELRKFLKDLGYKAYSREFKNMKKAELVSFIVEDAKKYQKKEELIEQTCPHCKRNEEECEKNAEGEKNPITEWCGWGLSCDDCYYKNHPESDDEEEKKYKIENGCISFDFYKTFLSNHMPSNKMNQKIIKWFEENEDEVLEYKAFTITRKNENNVCYSECILLDFDDKFIPIIMTGINTSSSYAMSRCGMGREEDEDEIEETMTLDEIDEMLNIKSDFKTVINNLEN